MATFYYITATAPATLFVAGRRMQLSTGDSRGPFSEAEKDLIMSGPDRRRLYVTSHEKADDTPPAEVSQTSVDGLGLAAPSPSEQPEPEVPTSGLSYEESTPEPALEVEPLHPASDDVNSPLTASEQDLVNQSVSEVLPEPETELGESHTAMSAALDPEPSEPEEEDPTITRARRRRRSN